MQFFYSLHYLVKLKPGCVYAEMPMYLKPNISFQAYLAKRTLDTQASSPTTTTTPQPFAISPMAAQPPNKQLPLQCQLVDCQALVNQPKLTIVTANHRAIPTATYQLYMFATDDNSLGPQCFRPAAVAADHLEVYFSIAAWHKCGDYRYELHVSNKVFHNIPGKEYSILPGGNVELESQVVEDPMMYYFPDEPMTDVNVSNLIQYSFVSNKTVHGFTLAHYCAVEGWAELLAEQFKQNIPNVMDKDMYGWSPMDYALEFGRKNVVAVILKYTSKVGWQPSDWDKQVYTFNLNPNFHVLYDEYAEWYKKESIEKLLLQRAQQFLSNLNISVPLNVNSLTNECVKLYCSNTQYCGKSFYSYVNHALYHDNMEQLKIVMPIIRLINNYLRFDVYNEHNKPCIVYKRCNMSSDLLQQMVPETSFRFPTFTTTTTSASNVLQQSGNVILEIHVPEHGKAPHYRNVNRESDFVQEEEVVFVPYSKFSVVQVTGSTSNAVTRVVLKANDNQTEPRPEMPMACPEKLLKIPVLPRSRKIVLGSVL